MYRVQSLSCVNNIITIIIIIIIIQFVNPIMFTIGYNIIIVV